MGRVNVILKGFTSIDKDHGDFLAIEAEQCGMLADIDFSEDKSMGGLEITKYRFRSTAEMACGRAQDFDHGHGLWGVRHIFLRKQGIDRVASNYKGML